MYKILVADDEQLVLDSIKFIIEKNFNDVEVSGTARSGREAIEKTELLTPDIIFMDIMMPGINGIEAIREIKSRFRNIHFIILTAYEQFDFAKEAVHLGVEEFLTKPVNRDKIVETVRRMIETISQEREKRRRELELREKFENVLPVLENGFIYSTLFFDDQSREVANYLNIFDIVEDSSYIMTIEFGEAEDTGIIENRIGLSVKSISFYPYLRELVKRRCKCIIGPPMLNRVFVLVPVNINADEYAQRLEVVNVAEHIYNSLAEKIEADFAVGIGRIYKGFDCISRSYKESLRALRYAKGKGIVHITDIPDEVHISYEYPISQENLLLERASVGDVNACIQAFSIIFDWLRNEYPQNVQNVKNKLIELIVLLHRMAQDYGTGNGKTQKDDYLAEILMIKDIPELNIWFKEKIELFTRNISAAREKRVSGLILKAVEYISGNYQNEITLEDVSREVNISPQYFSKLFKDEMGKTFIDYLTYIRMEKAKKYLVDGKFSIKEICFSIGYGDPNYFSRIFKKEVGVTPTEYRINVLNKE